MVYPMRTSMSMVSRRSGRECDCHAAAAREHDAGLIDDHVGLTAGGVGFFEHLGRS